MNPTSSVDSLNEIKMSPWQLSDTDVRCVSRWIGAVVTMFSYSHLQSSIQFTNSSLFWRIFTARTNFFLHLCPASEAILQSNGLVSSCQMRDKGELKTSTDTWGTILEIFGYPRCSQSALRSFALSRGRRLLQWFDAKVIKLRISATVEEAAICGNSESSESWKQF